MWVVYVCGDEYLVLVIDYECLLIVGDINWFFCICDWYN